MTAEQFGAATGRLIVRAISRLPVRRRDAVGAFLCVKTEALQSAVLRFNAWLSEKAAHRECEEAQPGRCACGNELLTDYEREIGMCAFCDHAADFYGCRDGAGGAGR